MLRNSSDSKFSRKGFIASIIIAYAVSFFVLFVGVLTGFRLQYLYVSLFSSTELVSLLSMLLLVPLYLWGRKLSSAPNRVEYEGKETKTRAVGLPIVLYLLAVLSLTHIGITFLVILTLLLAEKYSPSSFGFTSGKFWRNLSLGLFLYCIGSLLPLAFGYVSPILPGAFRAVSLQGYDFRIFLFALPSAVLLIALAEEAMLRGYMQTKLSGLIGGWKAVLIQAVLFGLAHLQPGMTPDTAVARVATTFLFGVLTGSFYQYTRSLVGVVIVHGLADSAYRGFKPVAISSFPISLSAVFRSIVTGRITTVLAILVTDPSFIVGLYSLAFVALCCVFARRICKAFGALAERPLAGHVEA